MNNRIITFIISLALLFSTTRAEDVSVEIVATPEVVISATLDVPEITTQVIECEGGDPWGERSIPIDIDTGEELVTIPEITVSETTSDIEVVPQVVECCIGGNDWETSVAPLPFEGPFIPEVVPEIIVCPGIEEPIAVSLINIQKNIPEIVQLKVTGVEAISREVEVLISDGDIVISD